VKPDGTFRLDMRYFGYATALRMTTGRFDALFGGPPRAPDAPAPADEFDRPPRAVLKAAVFGGVSLPWNLGLAALLGLLLLFTRPLLGADGTPAHAHHVIGSLVLTVVSIAAAEVARPVRFLNLLLGVALAASALLLQADRPTLLFSLLVGAALAGLSIRRGPILERYGSWSRLLV